MVSDGARNKGKRSRTASTDSLCAHPDSPLSTLPEPPTRCALGVTFSMHDVISRFKRLACPGAVDDSADVLVGAQRLADAVSSVAPVHLAAALMLSTKLLSTQCSERRIAIDQKSARCITISELRIAH